MLRRTGQRPTTSWHPLRRRSTGTRRQPPTQGRRPTRFPLASRYSTHGASAARGQMRATGRSCCSRPVASRLPPAPGGSRAGRAARAPATAAARRPAQTTPFPRRRSDRAAAAPRATRSHPRRTGGGVRRRGTRRPTHAVGGPVQTTCASGPRTGPTRHRRASPG